jgi:PAS domain-containing protein
MAEHTSSMIFIQYLTTVFDNIKDSVLFIGVERNHAYRLLMANHAFYTSTGHRENDIGKELHEIVAPSSYQKLVAHYDEVVKTKKPLEFTDTYDVPSGQRMYEVSLIPVLNAVGEAIQIAAISRDVTEIHNLRDLAETSAETLEQMVRDLREA